MFDLDRRGFAISAALGLVTGLISAWVIWDETPKPAGPPQVASTAVQPARAPAGEDRVTPALSPPGAEPERPKLPVHLLDLDQAKEVDGHLQQDLGEGQMVEYTVIPAVQRRANQVLRQAEVPFGAMVALEPSTGRVLGYAQHSSSLPTLRHIATLSNPPTASVFKLVTTAALLEHANVAPDYEVCFHGGSRGFNLRHLQDNPRLDTTCQTLTEALARSSNVVFGKLADRFLDARTLDAYAQALGWKREIPFVFPVEPSDAQFSDEKLRFARTAAGFYNTHMSPVHGATLAAAIANDGVVMAPELIERFVVDGEPVTTRSSRPLWRALRSKTARVLANMMVSTTEMGTARAYFSKRDKSLKGVRVAAKTGSLSARGADGETYHFSWWVGFAPAENPRIALAAMVVNVGKWRIKSTYLARETLEAYFAAIQKGDVSAR